MGCSFSSGASQPFDGVRVIHINGYVEDFDPPVTVGRVTGKPATSRHVLCSSAHLLQPGRGLSRPDDPLEPGRVYFLLPHSVFRSESSPVDLACLMNRLTALAKKGGSGHAGPSPIQSLFARAGSESPARDIRPGPAPSEPARPDPWKPQLDRIEESMRKDSMRSTCSSTCGGSS